MGGGGGGSGGGGVCVSVCVCMCVCVGGGGVEGNEYFSHLIVLRSIIIEVRQTSVSMKSCTSTRDIDSIYRMPVTRNICPTTKTVLSKYITRSKCCSCHSIYLEGTSCSQNSIKTC